MTMKEESTRKNRKQKRSKARSAEDGTLKGSKRVELIEGAKQAEQIQGTKQIYLIKGSTQEQIPEIKQVDEKKRFKTG